jgi:hypothetical protein
MHTKKEDRAFVAALAVMAVVSALIVKASILITGVTA